MLRRISEIKKASSGCFVVLLTAHQVSIAAFMLPETVPGTKYCNSPLFARFMACCAVMLSENLSISGTLPV